MSYEFPKDKPVTPGQDNPDKSNPGQQCPADPSNGGSPSNNPSRNDPYPVEGDEIRKDPDE